MSTPSNEVKEFLRQAMQAVLMRVKLMHTEVETIVLPRALGLL